MKVSCDASKLHPQLRRSLVRSATRKARRSSGKPGAAHILFLRPGDSRCRLVLPAFSPAAAPHCHQRPPELVGVVGDESYSSVIRELYLPSGYQLCPEMTAIRSGLHNGIFSMAEFGADNFLASDCYSAYYGALEIRNFYDLFCDLGDGRVVGWSICRHLGEPDFTAAEDRRLRWLAPLLVGLVARHCQLAFPARVRLATGTR
jgi:hypothetical protein